MRRFPLAAMALTLAAPTALAMGVLPNCLDQLSSRTKTWTECTARFSRDARECKPSTAKMWQSMQTCERKGYSKAEIDEAMAHGAAIAGRKNAKPEPPPPPPPTPKAKPGPIPGINPLPTTKPDT